MAKKILVAMDASEHAMKAAGYVAGTLKGCKDVKVTLFSVIPEVSAAFKTLVGTDFASVIPDFERKLGDLATLRHKQEAKIEETLEQAKEMLQKSGIPEDNIEIAVRRKKEGIARDILRELEKGAYDTIVVGRRGVSGAFFFGSVSDKIVKYARNCAVWVID